MHQHAKIFWGEDNVERANASANIKLMRDAFNDARMIDGTLTAIFERTGKGKVTYSAHQHTWSETQ